MYTCKYFKIEELVPRSVYQARGDKAWELLDREALITLDKLREKFGPAIVNNWATGGSREWSGLRTEDSPYGSKYSQHRYGRAFDVIFLKTKTDNVREYILNNPEEFEYIRGIELETSWLHFDTGNRRGNNIFTFKP